MLEILEVSKSGYYEWVKRTPSALKERKEQIKQVKMEIQAKDKSEVEERLRWQYGYEVINGLKIK